MKYRLYTNTVNKNGEKVYVQNNDTDIFDTNELIETLEYDGTLAKKAKLDKLIYTIEKADDTPIDKKEMKHLKELLNQVNISDEDIENERVKRLKMLKLETMALNDAITNKTFWISENTGYPFNINYFLNGYSYEKEVREAINKITKLGGTPYFAIVDHLKDGGLWVSVLYVSPYKNEWKNERPNKNGIMFAGVYNTNLKNIDYGDIQIHIDKFAGSVKRIA